MGFCMGKEEKISRRHGGKSNAREGDQEQHF
jgi:hypothetical protein